MNETWFKDNWRPLAAYTYIFICICDFIIFPVGNMLVCYYLHTPYVVWVPLTLQGGAFLHLSFGAILGAGAYTQGLSQIEMIKNMPDYSQMKTLNTTITYTGRDVREKAIKFMISEFKRCQTGVSSTVKINGDGTFYEPL